MKQQDVAIIIVVVFFSAILSIMITRTVFTPQKNKELTVETVNPISSEFKQPDPQVFNSNSINPTQLIQIGDGNNPGRF